jgi:hypothetical protein
LRALNRERSNVGRTAYTDRVKDILLACQGRDVADALAQDLQRFERGTAHDELQWINVAVHACQVLGAAERVLFVAASELVDYPSVVDRARADGIRVIVVPDTVRVKLPGLLDAADRPVRDLRQYVREWEQSFRFTFVPIEDLDGQERAVWDTTATIFRLAGGKPKAVRAVKISATMRPEGHDYREARGLWDPREGLIVIKRSELANVKSYAGTLLHELVHTKTEGADDLSAEFVDGLTTMLGSVAAKQLPSVPTS